MMLLVLISSIILSCISSATSQCDNEWQDYGSHCYFLSDTTALTEVNWHEARAYCLQYGAELSSIHSPEELDFILNMAEDQGYGGDLWIGLNQLSNREANYKWSDGNELVYEPWGPSQPNRDGNEKCIFTKTSPAALEEKEYWYSTNCGWEKGFVCKKPEGSSGPATVPPTQEVPGYCPKGFYGFGNKCYKLVQHSFETGISWNDARTKCMAEQGIEPDLASVTSVMEQAEISALLTNHSWGYWIGYRKYQNTWLWSDNSDPTFTNWGNDKYLDCAVVQTYPHPHGTWETLGCNDKRGWICQTFKDYANIISTPSSPNNCPSGFTSYWYGCYKLELTPRTFSEADAECRTQGSHLVSIHDEAENSAVYAFARQNFPLWIGLKNSNGEYKWLDGWPELYTKWGAGEPDNGEGCVAMEIDSRWSDTQCSKQLPFMCKYTEAAAPTTPAPEEGICPDDDWVEWGGHCFYFSSDMASWDDAVEQCRTRAGIAHKGNLASIHNEVTNEWVYQAFRDRDRQAAWIGLRRADLESPWAWVDDSPFSYHRWAPGEPNDPDGSNTCVEMYIRAWPGMWNDHSCSASNPFLCSAEKAPIPTTPTMPSQLPGDCPGPDWVHYGDACFLFKPDEFMDWSRANYECTQAGGDSLASIRDGAENWFIWQKLMETSIMPIRRGAWIGLMQTEESDNDKYHWFDGSSFDYENWASGQPSDPDHRCVETFTSNGQWSDQDCLDVLGYVCKFKKVTTGISETTFTPTPSEGATPPSDGGGLSGGAVTGIVFGVLISCALLTVAAYFGFMFWKQRNNPSIPQMTFTNHDYDDLKIITNNHTSVNEPTTDVAA